MKKIFLIDFDGTILTLNISEYILEQFADKKWHYYHNLFIEGKMSLEEILTAQYKLIKTPIDEIIAQVDSNIVVREHFKNFIIYLDKENIPFEIVTGGLDFTVKRALEKVDIKKTIKIIGAQLKQHSDLSMEVIPPIRHNKSIKDFKRDHVNYYKQQGYYVYYIGDSSSDFEAARESDMIFSVKNTELTSFCETNDFNYQEFTDFEEVIQFMQKRNE